MRYAEVAVNFPAIHPTFCYATPPHLDIDLGQAVWVPFGSRNVPGIVVKLSEQTSLETVKEIIDVISEHTLLSPLQIELAQWISQHYLAPLFDSLALMLPPDFGHKITTYFQPANTHTDTSSLPLRQKQVLKFIESKRKVSLPALERKFGKTKAKQLVVPLLRHALLIKNEKLEKTKIKPKSCTYIKLEIRHNEVATEISKLNKSRAFKQVALLEVLDKQAQPILVNEAEKRANCSLVSIKALVQRNIASIEKINVRRDPLSHFNIESKLPPNLTSSQESAWKSIEDRLNNIGNSSSPIFLLFGVTGSGKTELYLRALAKIVSQGKRGICLVPEIALTAQIVERFASRFPGQVAVLHSGLSAGEQFDEWQWIMEGNCSVVIGPRSALFSPQSDLGLIIIDEEHEWTYKQEDKSPRYHARDVAIKLAQLSGAAVILGSATPDIESFHQAQSGKYKIISLKERITPHGYSPLPEVSIVDLKKELKEGNTSLLSRSLSTAIEKTLERDEQIILFLNRRGTATFIQCRHCHFVFRCPRCSVALTYHSAERKLTCHRCSYSMPVPSSCPQCFSSNLRFFGVGTQRVEEEVKHLFPQARTLRWDKDVITRRYAHEELLQKFRDHKADILIGTQMIAKGLDLPQVTLAGIISADTGLNFPDFRTGERTFQLLCQVAGRAGRGVKAGKVIIQTYSPENYAIQAAAKHDYLGFYEQEINYRHQYHYPPFSQLIRLAYTHTNNDQCRRETEKMSHIIMAEKESKGLSDLNLIGPMPAFSARIRGRYRWQLILRGSNPAQIFSGLTLQQGWTVDVDPVGLS
ncbi:MAG: primosomal protein N' [Chloroflexota bacterium]|nr:primosomal protein N' [Chloroflexota bacterium]